MAYQFKPRKKVNLDVKRDIPEECPDLYREVFNSISIVNSSTQNTTLNSINPRKIHVIYVRLVNLTIVNPKS